ncbi:VWD domain-containing protein, partial [Methylocapsa sp. S129]|uniref:beta strand repeat-containing protein n=1 Tax=Methylocapsa sp. S129 TaxID=1641869 RepID=UPI001AEEBC12
MAPKSWNGNSDDWTTAADWAPDGVPGAADDVTINAGDPQITTDVGTVNSVTVLATLDLATGGALATTGDFDNIGSVYLDQNSANGGSSLVVGGTLNNSGFLSIGGVAQGGGAPDTVARRSALVAMPASGSAGSLPPDTVVANSLSNANSGFIDLEGAPTNVATLDVNSTAGFGAAGVLTGDVTLSDDTLLEFASGEITTLDGSLTIEGANAFVADAVAGGGAPTSNSALTGLSTIDGSANGGLSLSGGATVTTVGPLSSTGFINLDNGSSLDVNSAAGLGTAGVLSGVVNLSEGGVLEFASGEIASIAQGAEVSLVGQNSYVADAVAGGGDPTSNSALTGLASNAGGALDLEAGASITTTGDFDNSGSLRVDEEFSGGSSLAIGGTLSNIGTIQIGSGATGGFGGLADAATVTAEGLSNSTGFIDLAGSSTATATLDVNAAAGFGTAGVLTGEIELSGDALLEFASGEITSIAAGSSLALSGDNAYVADAVAGGGAPTSNSALTGLASNAGNLTVEGASLTTGSLNNTGTILVNSIVTGDNEQVVSSGLLDVNGTLSGGGSVTIDGGTLELGGVASGTISFGGIFEDAPATLMLDAPADFGGTIDGLSTGDTIDLANIAATSAVISGDALTVTESNGQTLQYQLSNVQTDSQFTIQSDNADGSDLVLSTGAVPPVITAPATATATEGIAASLGTLSIADANPDAGTLTVDLEANGFGQGGTLAADQSGAATVVNEGGTLVLTGDLTDVNNELATLTYTGALRTSSATTWDDSIFVDVSDSTGQNAQQSIDITVGVGPLVITAPQTAMAVDFTASSLGGLSLADSNGASEPLTVTVSAGIGALAAAQSGAATVVGDNTGQLILTGTAADINNELASLTYTGTGLPPNNNGDTATDSVTIDATDAQGSKDQQIVGVTVDVAPYENFMNDASTLEADVNAFVSQAQIIADAVNVQADAVSGAIGTLAGIAFQQAYDGSSQVIRNLGAEFAMGDTSDVQDFSDLLDDSILNGAVGTIAGGATLPANDGFAASIRSIINDGVNGSTGDIGIDSEIFQLDIKNFVQTLAGSAFDDAAWQTVYNDGIQAETAFVTDVVNGAGSAQILADTSGLFTTMNTDALAAIGGAAASQQAAAAAESSLSAVNADIAGGASAETILSDANGVYEPLVAQQASATATSGAIEAYDTSVAADQNFGTVVATENVSKIMQASIALYNQTLPSILSSTSTSPVLSALLSTMSTLTDEIGAGDTQSAVQTATSFLSQYLGSNGTTAAQLFQQMMLAAPDPSSPSAILNYDGQALAVLATVAEDQNPEEQSAILQSLQAIETDFANSSDQGTQSQGSQGGSNSSSSADMGLQALENLFNTQIPDTTTPLDNPTLPIPYAGTDQSTQNLVNASLNVITPFLVQEVGAPALLAALGEGVFTTALGGLLAAELGPVLLVIALSQAALAAVQFTLEHRQQIQGVVNRLPGAYNQFIKDPQGTTDGVLTPIDQAFGLGDVHLTTFTGLYYNFQAEGEFVLTKSTEAGNSFQIQVRLQPWTNSTGVTVTTELGAQVGSDRVTFDINRPDMVFVNGAATNLSATNSVLNLAGGQIVELSPSAFQLTWNTGESLTVTNAGSYLNYSVQLGPNDGPGSVEGLLGSAESQANDLALPDGTVLTQPLTSSQLYGTYANAWRITDATSLLDYDPGQTTASFTDVNFPGDSLTLADLPSSLVAQAAQLAAAAGITDPTLAAGAELDYLATGDASFFTSAANAQQLDTTVTAVDVTPSLAAASLGVTAAQQTIVPAAGQSVQATFNIYLTSAVGTDTTVDYQVVAPDAQDLGSSSFGGTLPSGQATIVAGQTSGAFTIALPANVLGANPTSTLEVEISSPSGAPVFASTAQTEIVNPMPEPGAAPLPSLAEITNFGTPTQAGSAYTLDLGTLVQGETIPYLQLAVLNGATAPADELGGTISAGGTGSGFILTGGGALSPIAAGEDYANLHAVVDTSTVGQNSETITLLPTDVNASGYSAALSNLTLTIDDTIIAPAQVVVNSPTTIDFGNLRVGATANQAVSITNSAAAGAANLDASVSVNGGALASGAISDLAPGATDATDLSVGLQTSVAGASSGEVTLNLASDAGGGNTAALLGQAIEVSGNVYREAAAQIAPINETVHVGDPGTASLIVTNDDPADGYSENLLASVATTTGAISATGATGEIAAGGSDSSSLAVAFSTQSAGTVAGSVTLNLETDGTGIDGLGPTSLTPTTVGVDITVDNYAQAAFAETSGGGVLSQNGANYTLNLGDIALDSGPLAIGLEALNAASGTADLLSGSFQIAGSSAFAASGLDDFSGLGARQADSAPSVSLNTSAAGTFSTTITLTSTGSNASGYSAPLTTETLTIEATVQPEAAVAPTITGTVSGQTTTSEAPVAPFSGVTIGDANSNAAGTLTDTLTITVGGAGGTLSGAGVAANGVYTLIGTAAAITSALDAVTFAPTAGAPGSNSTSTFTLSDQSSAFATATVDDATSVIDSDPAVAGPTAPTITGTQVDQTTASEAPVSPFSGVTIGDANSGATDTVTITVGGPGGALSGAGLTGGADGVYTLTGTAAAVTSAIDALVFTPTGGGSGTESVNTFTVSDTSSAFPTPTAGIAPSLIDIDPNPAVLTYIPPPSTNINIVPTEDGGDDDGDPHLTTFDGFHYDFQQVGEFVLTKSIAPGDNFQVQIRTAPYYNGATVAVTTQVGVALGADRVTIDLTRPDTLEVDGAAVTLTASNNADTLAGGTIELIAPNTYQISSIHGETVDVTNYGTFLDVNTTLGPNFPAGDVVGLLGTDTGNPANDFQTADGTILQPPLTLNQLYQEFGDSWRVTDATSLLDYGPGQTTATFTDLNFPADAISLAQLPTSVVEAAAAAVAAAGITDPTLRDDAIYDYALTNDKSFITGALTAQQEGVTTPLQLTPTDTSSTLGLGITAPTLSVAEPTTGTTAVSFTVYSTAVVTSATVVDYAVIAPGAGFLDATAFGGTLPSGQVTIAAGQSSATFTIAVPSTALGLTPSDLMRVQISDAVGTPVIAPTADVTIANATATQGVDAVPGFAETSGGGTLTQSGNAYTLALGTLTMGATASVGLAATNAAATGADQLGGSFVLSGDGGFTVTGAGAFSGIAAGGIQAGIDVAANTSVAGAHSETITFAPTESNASGFNGSLATVSLTITDMVMAGAAPTITGTVAGQTATPENPIAAFSGVTIADANANATDTLTITIGGWGGALSGAGVASNGVYTLTGSAATVTSALDAVLFTPTAGAPGANLTSTFTLSDTSSANPTPTVDANTSVLDIDPNHVSVATFEADQAALDEIAGGFAISDTAANIYNGLTNIEADQSHITAISATDMLVAVGALTFTPDETVLNKIVGGFDILGLSTRIEAVFDSLEADVDHINSIATVDAPITVSATTFENDQTALNKVVGGFDISDTETDIANALPNLLADVSHIASITSTDTPVTVGANSFVFNEAVLNTIVGGFDIVAGVPANVEADLGVMTADISHINSIVSTGGPIVVSAATFES